MSRSSAANRMAKQRGPDKKTNKVKRREAAQRREQSALMARDASKASRSRLI